MSAPLPEGAVHLLVADDGLTEGQVYRVFMAVCGELVPASGLAPSLCPDECDRDHPYCSACVREVVHRSAEAGAQAAQDAGSQPEGHFTGGCGHRVPGGPVFHVGPCRDCDPGAT